MSSPGPGRAAFGRRHSLRERRPRELKPRAQKGVGIAMRTQSRSVGWLGWPERAPAGGVTMTPALLRYRTPRRTWREAISPSVLRVELTERAVGNIWATSGSRTTTLLPAAYRCAYLPRTPPVKSYSASIVSFDLGFLVFFISPTFSPGSLPSAYQANSISPLRVHDHNDSSSKGAAQQNKSLFPYRMIRIANRARAKVTEGG